MCSAPSCGGTRSCLRTEANETLLSNRLQMAGHVLCNILRGHTGIYNAIKAAPGGAKVAVGIVHNVFWLEPKGTGPLYAHVRWVLQSCGHLFLHVGDHPFP